MGKTILILTRSDTEAKYLGGSAFHLMNMVGVLKANGHKVSCAQLKSGAYDAVLTDDEINGVLSLILDLQPDVVIADYSWMCSAFTYELPVSVMPVCFVHDLRCRIVPCLEAIGYKDPQEWNEEKEAELLRRAEVLLVLNNDDAEFCKRMAPDAKIVRMGIAMDLVEHDETKEIPGRCIYVGSNNMENRFAFAWFSREVWPLVLQEVPHASLDALSGRVDDIDDRYNQAQLAVVPHIMHGGKKLKIAEALSHNLVPIGNLCAFDGFNGCEQWASDEPSGFAKLIIEYLNNANLRKVPPSFHDDMRQEVAYGKLLEELK